VSIRSRIEFGTAGPINCENVFVGTNDHDHRTSLGLRGRMEAGWSRMNDLIVIQASQVRESVLILQIEDNRRAV